MLLKIYTDRNTLVVIEDIEEIEIHNETFYARDISDARDNPLFGPAASSAVPLPSKFHYYDSGKEPRFADAAVPGGIPLKFIDYRKKGGYWERVAIGFYGVCYLCNDVGRTIERILEPGRAAA